MLWGKKQRAIYTHACVYIYIYIYICITNHLLLSSLLVLFFTSHSQGSYDWWGQAPTCCRRRGEKLPSSRHTLANLDPNPVHHILSGYFYFLGLNSKLESSWCVPGQKKRSWCCGIKKLDLDSNKQVNRNVKCFLCGWDFQGICSWLSYLFLLLYHYHSAFTSQYRIHHAIFIRLFNKS